MRLGEAKNIIECCLDENNQLFIDKEALYWNQAYKINNYWDLIVIFDLLYNQEWNDADNSVLDNLIEKYWRNASSVQIGAEEFNQLNTYVSRINSKMPIYYSILSTFADDQEEQLINIKIPSWYLSSLRDLSRFNERLDKIFTQFQMDGQFEFKWLDTGTDRYKILVVWFTTYNVFIACLSVAQKILELKKTYYESKKAKLDYQAALSGQDKYTEKWFNSYKEKRIELEIKSHIEEILEKINIENWKSNLEKQNQIIIATKSLIKELWDWTEFHLSLNPPEYAQESKWSLKIDYKKISSIISKDTSPKGIKDNRSSDELDSKDDKK